MAKRNEDNLRIVRKYLLWLGDARGLSEASVDKAAASIATYEAFLGEKDFRAFHSDRARAFKRHLASAHGRADGGQRAQGTINGSLRDVMAFFQWLADQAGYKSKIDRSDIAYFTPDKKSETARRTACWKPHPSPGQVRQMLDAMPAKTLIERRDRALVAFLFLSGSGESAAISLRLGHVDLANACVHFDGKTVDTKFGKSFTTAFYPIGGSAERILRDWTTELRTAQLYSDADPLFPKTDVRPGPDRRFKQMGLLREP